MERQSYSSYMSYKVSALSGISNQRNSTQLQETCLSRAQSFMRFDYSTILEMSMC